MAVRFAHGVDTIGWKTRFVTANYTEASTGPMQSHRVFATSCPACAAPLAHDAPRCDAVSLASMTQAMCKKIHRGATLNNTTPTKNTRRPSVAVEAMGAVDKSIRCQLPLEGRFSEITLDILRLSKLLMEQHHYRASACLHMRLKSRWRHRIEDFAEFSLSEGF